ncbi:cell division ATP-binding protein FtsE [Natranaerobius trueperi]|uniref:Cell division ATP-binding protein FtsE n=1 Tax=Natranaerobius trueperi TaxID=759412 RepID=A0A226BZV2_9FIRM|nr:cell division ATP-binding protein FtsE [Natranaerobius trueperi]OWZ83719.1 cell division ATP-binding protein FtsE [Natranaerobius trueperi]
MIELSNVNKFYDKNVEALKEVNVKIDKGEFVFLVGPSGAGKSTFIKLLYREVLPSSGKVMINGWNVTEMKKRHIPKLRRSIGIVFQDYHLLTGRSVYENVAFAMRVVEASNKEIRERVPKLLDMVGLSHRKNQEIDKLSGGEKQRAAIARALVNQPSILITDEPTGNLDPETSDEIMDLLKKINVQGTTVIMATHDREIVDRMQKRVIRIDQGKVVRDMARSGYGYEV